MCEKREKENKKMRGTKREKVRREEAEMER
jgi:hypothetical protein